MWDASKVIKWSFLNHKRQHFVIFTSNKTLNWVKDVNFNFWERNVRNLWGVLDDEIIIIDWWIKIVCCRMNRGNKRWRKRKEREKECTNTHRVNAYQLPLETTCKWIRHTHIVYGQSHTILILLLVLPVTGFYLSFIILSSARLGFVFVLLLIWNFEM